jgi:hypothetical protein
MTDPAQTEIDDLLSQAANIKPVVPQSLMARVLIDADIAQPRQTDTTDQSFWASLRDMIGGWPGVGGLAMASLTGLWIGVAPPVGLEMMTTDMLGTIQTVDLFGGDMLGNFSDELDG